MILLTGVTGKTGGAAASELIKKGVSLRALVRDADKASALKEAGVELVVGDAAERDVVARALDGVEKALLILPNSQEQQDMEMQFVDLAAEAGVRHFVKLSSLEALPEATSPIPSMHYAVEQHICTTDMDWTMIKPNFFMQNLLPSGFVIKAEGKFYLPMGDGVTVMMDCRDIGAVIAEVLVGTDHEGQSYKISGPELITFHDVADQFSEVLGKKVEYVNQDPAAYRERVAPFLSSEWHLDAVMHLFSEVVDGVVMPTVTDTFEQLVGREPIPFRRFVQDHIGVYQ
ncbi:MAG: SDR family oxidoreductase [Gammaproteobacteria bacterium]|jgi:uncharacterized protein YbjT (DUF2867 family)|nr:hypothetical protein [Chromatiales bacterium]MDP6674582.1 SDR family oxidoreductase [Gammaproteobacteria bacterium]